jgi:Tol biopolymer transport system component
MARAHHKVNHLLYSPSGQRFAFMHRWLGPQGKFSRLYTANSKDGRELYCLADERMVSHYAWYDDEHLLAWARKNPWGDRYFLMKDQTAEFSIIGENILNKFGDGHPSFSSDRRWLVTDTYPDKARRRHLLLFNLETKKLIHLGKFLAPWRYDGPTRCDLHPRWNHKGDKISIDSVHEGFRCSYIIDVSEIISHG